MTGENSAMRLCHWPTGTDKQAQTEQLDVTGLHKDRKTQRWSDRQTETDSKKDSIEIFCQRLLNIAQGRRSRVTFYEPIAKNFQR